MAVYVFDACCLTLWVERSVATHSTEFNWETGKKTEDSDDSSKLKRKHDYSVTSVHYAQVHKSIIYVTAPLAESTHQQIICGKAFKTQKLKVLHIWTKPVIILVAISCDITLAPAKSFVYSSYFAKVSVAV